MIDQLGKPRFEHALLEHLMPLVPAASCSIYRTGRGCEPRLFMSASRGVPDTTRDCWRAYLSGPYLRDRTFASGEPAADETLLCHISAGEVPPEHRARVYEAHGVAERVSVVRSHVNGSLFAVNFYRHRHQRPFSDAQLADFGAMAPALLSLTRRHVELALPDAGVPDGRAALLQASADLTPRELDVCLRILQGMTQEGIALDLGVGVPTVKTYRNRAFERLGIHFRNELFALVLKHRTIN
ncbi:MAG: LuxR family transcriptional regulator [Comamonadaceae bacterium]|nr:MAG: LuxR family transcriptional regulator [Comamonadaceae bacterium]